MIDLYKRRCRMEDGGVFYVYFEEDLIKAVKSLKKKLGTYGDIKDAQGNINDGIIDKIFGEELK